MIIIPMAWPDPICRRSNKAYPDARNLKTLIVKVCADSVDNYRHTLPVCNQPD